MHEFGEPQRALQLDVVLGPLPMRRVNTGTIGNMKSAERRAQRHRHDSSTATRIFSSSSTAIRSTAREPSDFKTLDGWS